MIGYYYLAETENTALFFAAKDYVGFLPFSSHGLKNGTNSSKTAIAIRVNGPAYLI